MPPGVVVNRFYTADLRGGMTFLSADIWHEGSVV